MRTLFLYVTLGLLAGAIVALFLFRGAQEAGERLARNRAETLATWEEELNR